MKLLKRAYRWMTAIMIAYCQGGKPKLSKRVCRFWANFRTTFINTRWASPEACRSTTYHPQVEATIITRASNKTSKNSAKSKTQWESTNQLFVPTTKWKLKFETKSLNGESKEISPSKTPKSEMKDRIFRASSNREQGLDCCHRKTSLIAFQSSSTRRSRTLTSHTSWKTCQEHRGSLIFHRGSLIRTRRYSLLLIL